MPSLTEDLFAIGAGAQVVGVSEFTDHPAGARKLPVIASFSAVDTERVVRLHPDVVVGIAAQSTLGAQIAKIGIPIVLYRDDDYDDIFFDLDGLGVLSGHRAQARRLIARLQSQTRAVVARVPRRAKRPSVFVVLNVDPIYTVGAGSYIARLIALAGATNAADDVHDPYSRYSAEALVAHQPDVLVVDPATNLGSVLERAPWNALRAVREHRVFTLSDAGILERPGPRYVEGLRWLVDRLAQAAV